MSGVLESLRVLAAVLDDLCVPFALIGGHAVNAWLEPRVTADVDVTIEANAALLAGIKTRLLSLGYRVAREHGVSLPSGPDFIRWVSCDGALVVEMQVAKTHLQSRVIERAVRRDGSIPVATPEDLLVLKLIANRPKDQADISGLVALSAMDWPYVQQAAEEWGVLELLGQKRFRS